MTPQPQPYNPASILQAVKNRQRITEAAHKFRADVCTLNYWEQVLREEPPDQRHHFAPCHAAAVRQAKASGNAYSAAIEGKATNTEQLQVLSEISTIFLKYPGY